MGFFWTCALKFIKYLWRGKKRKNDLMKKKLNIVFGHTTLYGRKFLTLFLSKSVYLIHFTLFFCFIAQNQFFFLQLTIKVIIAFFWGGAMFVWGLSMVLYIWDKIISLQFWASTTLIVKFFEKWPPNLFFFNQKI